MIIETRTKMTAAEFAALPETAERMELINGEVIVSSSSEYVHQQIVGTTFNRLSQLNRHLPQPGIVVISPMDVNLDDENTVQPDIFWVSGKNSLCKSGQDNYWYGASDLVIEVLSPTRYDRKEKFELYQRFGSREYWMIDPAAQYLEVWTRQDERFVRQGVYGPDDSFTSAVLGGCKQPHA